MTPRIRKSSSRAAMASMTAGGWVPPPDARAPSRSLLVGPRADILHPLLTRDDLADPVATVSQLGGPGDQSVGMAGLCRQHQADAHVEDPVHLLLLHPADLHDQLTDRRGPPPAATHPAPPLGPPN